MMDEHGAGWEPFPEGLIYWVTRPGCPGAASAVITHRELSNQTAEQIAVIKEIRIANAARALKESDGEA